MTSNSQEHCILVILPVFCYEEIWGFNLPSLVVVIIELSKKKKKKKKKIMIHNNPIRTI